jgi:drug/metabolite transporter (DMT)-like permease
VVVLVLSSAAVGALALVLLRKATMAEPGAPAVSLALLWFLVRHRPVWAAGVAAMVVEVVLQVLALAGGPVSTVQLLVVMELPFCLVLSSLILGGRLAVREWSAIAAMTLGIIVLLLNLSAHGGNPNSPDLATWSLGLAVTVAVIATALVAGRWAGAATRTALRGIAAGMTAGLVAVLVKPVTATVARGWGAVLGTWQAWAVLAAGAVAFLLLQNALRTGPLVASQPGITLANPLTAAVWGVVVFHEQVRTGWWLAGAGLGAVLLAGGAVLLSGSPLLRTEVGSGAQLVAPRVAGGEPQQSPNLGRRCAGRVRPVHRPHHDLVAEAASGLRDQIVAGG